MKSRIGIVGGGQLARMLAFDAKKMGFTVTVLDPTPHSPAGQVCDEQIVAPLDNQKAMLVLADKSDYLTFDWELADANLLHQFEQSGVKVNPSAQTLGIIKDKLVQKQFLRDAVLPVDEFYEVKNKVDIAKIAEKTGYPLLLKSRRGGYDGKGNAVIENPATIDAAFEKLAGTDLYAEKFVPFVKELSVMVARSMDGIISTFPVVENIHKNNILHMTIAPAQISEAEARTATKVAIETMEHLQGAGVFGIEMFLCRDSSVYINEIAPRVHNSGHYTIEACVTSQFEQHIRAISGLPLGETTMMTPAAVMVNILGDRTGSVHVAGFDEALKIPAVTVHIYGKETVKPGRKMGHVTAVAASTKEAIEKATQARGLITI